MKRWIAWITAVCCLGMLFCVPVRAAEPVWDGTVAEEFAGGSGTAEDPYLISNGAQLAHIGSTGYYKLTADIRLNDTAGWENWTAESGPANAWTPLGQEDQNQFSGTLDGEGHTISSLYVSSEQNEYGGLLRQISNQGCVKI